MHVDRLSAPLPARSPDLLKNPPPFENRTGVASKEREQVELLGRERESRAVKTRGPVTRVAFELAGREQPSGVPLPLRTAGNGTHPGQELAESERLSHLNCGRELKGRHTVSLVL